jgi:hypothetical protein
VLTELPKLEDLRLGDVIFQEVRPTLLRLPHLKVMKCQCRVDLTRLLQRLELLHPNVLTVSDLLALAPLSETLESFQVAVDHSIQMAEADIEKNISVLYSFTKLYCLEIFTRENILLRPTHVQTIGTSLRRLRVFAFSAGPGGFSQEYIAPLGYFPLLEEL